jgi:hypothetical protein
MRDLAYAGRVDTNTTMRSWAERLLIGVLIFLGVTAAGGGAEMLLFPKGNEYLPDTLLEPLPVESFVLPGLILLLGFGIGSLLVAWGMLTRRDLRFMETLEDRAGYHWSWLGAVAIGVGFTAWMFVEIALLGPPWGGGPDDQMFAWILYGIYLTVAGLLVTLPRSKSVRARYMV